MMNEAKTEKPVKKNNKLQLKSNIFYAALMVFPVVQFVLFYIVVNFKSFGYAFMHRETLANGEQVWHFTFAKITEWFTNSSNLRDLLQTSKMSLIYYGFTLLVSIPLALLFSYYIFKKLPGAAAFRIFLFIPSIVPAAAFALTFKTILNEVSPELLNGASTLKFDKNQFLWILVYNLYVGFGTSVLMYANKMFDISPEVIEAGKLDGASGFKEFWYIVLPLTYSTLSVFLVTGIATIFTNQYNLYLFNAYSNTRSLGFYIYQLAGETRASEEKVPHVAALGLILTCVAVPLTFLVKYCLEKFGPSED